MSDAVAVALVAAIPATISALAAWKNSRTTRKIVQGNGQGDVGVMLGKLTKWSRQHEMDDVVRHHELKQELGDLTSQVAKLTSVVTVVFGRHETLWHDYLERREHEQQDLRARRSGGGGGKRAVGPG
jgi:hypothetical protein